MASNNQTGDEISSFIDEAAITREKNVLIGALQEALGLFTEIHNLEKNLTPGTGFKDAAKSIADYNAKLDEVRNKQKEITDTREKSNRELQNEERLKQQRLKTSQQEIAVENEQIKQLLLLDKAEQQLAKTKEASSKIKPPTVEPVIVPGDSGAVQDEQGGISEADFHARKDAELEAQIAAQEFYDTVKIGTKATKEESEALKEIVLTYDKLTGSLSGNITAQVENAEALNRNKAQQKEIADAIKSQRAPTEEQTAALVRLKTEAIQLTEANKLLATVTRAQAREAVSAEGSADQLGAQLIALQATYTAMTEAEKKSPFGLETKNAIDLLDPKVKALDAEIGKFQKNVGNYSEAIGILKPALAEVGSQIDALTKSGKGNSDAVIALQKEYRILDQLLNSQEAGFANAKAEIQANEKALLQMAQAGLSGTESFKKLQVATGKLKDDLSDTRKATKALGSDTFVFDGLIEGAKGLAGVYGVAQSAAALFGVESEELQKTLVKLQAIQTLITSLQQIQNAVQKENAFILLLVQGREKGLLAITALKNFVLRGSVTATVANTAATTGTAAATTAASIATTIWTGTLTALRIALIATGIGAIVVLLVALAVAMSTTANATDLAVTANKNFEKSLDDGSAAIARQNDLLDKNLELKKLQNKFKLTGDALTTADTEAEINTLLEKRNNILAERKRIQEEVDRVTPAYNKLVTSGDVYADDENPIVKTIVAGVKRLKELDKETTELNHKITVTSVGARADAAQKNLAAEADARKKANDKAIADAKDYNARELAAQIELQKALLEFKKDQAKAIYDDDKLSFEVRLAALRAYQAASQKLIDLDANRTKTPDGKQKTPAELEASKQRGIAATFQLTIETQAKIDRLYKESFDNAQKQMDEDFQHYKDTLEKKKQLLDDAVELRKNKDSLKAIEEETPKINAAKGTDARAQAEQVLQDRLTNIERTAELTRSILREEELQAYLHMAEVLGQDTTKLQKLITDEQLKQSKIRGEIDDDEFDKKKENLEKEKALRKEIGGALQKLGIDLVQGQFDREKNAIQAKIDLIETEKNQKIEAVNAELISDQEKANKIAVINNVAEARKKQQEARQKQVDMDRARFERVASIASIVANTAVAATKALAETPLPAGAGFLAATLALGAIQVASVLARPLPKFKHGKNAGNPYSGDAIVDDGGRNEPIWRHATKTIELSTGPARDRITHVDSRDIVYTSIDDMLNKLSTPDVRPMVNVAGAVVNVDNSDVVRTLKNMNITTQFVTERGHHWRTQRLIDYNNYVNKYVK